jgi:hypothetical protein
MFNATKEKQMHSPNPLRVKTKIIVIWGLPKGETERYMEAVLSSRCKTEDDVRKVKAAAAADGWHSFRVATMDDNEKPDFASAVRP